MSETEKLWAVHTNSDLTEGRGRQFVRYWCKLQATAIRLAKRGYVQGSDCPISQIDVLILDGKRVLPANLINIEPPTPADEAAEKEIEARDAALSRAKAAGLSDDDIAIIAAGSRP